MFPPEHPKGFHPQPKLLNGVERRLAAVIAFENGGTFYSKFCHFVAPRGVK
jgi:hypothetical protein